MAKHTRLDIQALVCGEAIDEDNIKIVRRATRNRHEGMPLTLSEERRNCIDEEPETKLLLDKRNAAFHRVSDILAKTHLRTSNLLRVIERDFDNFSEETQAVLGDSVETRDFLLAAKEVKERSTSSGDIFKIVVGWNTRNTKKNG